VGEIVCDLTRSSCKVYFFDEVFDESLTFFYITRNNDILTNITEVLDELFGNNDFGEGNNFPLIQFKFQSLFIFSECLKFISDDFPGEDPLRYGIHQVIYFNLNPFNLPLKFQRL
jgi:hypothetical protein